MLSEDIRRVMRDSLRAYFAPLTGAIKGARAEIRRVDRDVNVRLERKAQRQGDQQSTRSA